MTIEERLAAALVVAGTWDRRGLPMDIEARLIAALPAHGLRLALAAKPDDGLRAALRLHYITAIDCDHAAKTDTVRCNCSVWTGTPQPSVGAAVEEWVDHVLGEEECHE